MKNRTTTIILLLLLFSFINTQAQDVKGLHVNNFKNIIGDTEEENILLSFAQEHQFNYLLLYNLYHVQQNLFDFTDEEEAEPLASFIHRAKSEYGIDAIGAVGEKFSSFEKIKLYNLDRPDSPSEQFDVLHTEFEFWNQNSIENSYCKYYLEEQSLPCDSSGAFVYYLHNLIQTKELADELGMMSETYIGNPTEGQCAMLAPHLDRIMLHYYRKSDVYNNGNSIYNFKKYRLEALTRSVDQVTILPIFSARSYYMGPWLLSHPMDQAFDTYVYGQNGFEEEEGEWKEKINLDGFQWYRYTDLLNYTGLSDGTSTERKDNSLALDKGLKKASVYPTLAKSNDFITVNCRANTITKFTSCNFLTLWLIKSWVYCIQNQIPYKQTNNS